MRLVTRFGVSPPGVGLAKISNIGAYVNRLRDWRLFLWVLDGREQGQQRVEVTVRHRTMSCFLRATAGSADGLLFSRKG